MPCTAQGRHDGLCGTHWHRNIPEDVARFNHDQEIYRDAWEGIVLGTHEIDVERQRVIRRRVAPPEVIAVAPTICSALKRDGVRCSNNATHPDGKCGMHHAVDRRRIEDAPRRGIIREMRRMYRAQASIADLDAYVATATETLAVRVRVDIKWTLDHMILGPFFSRIEAEIHTNRATQAQMDAILIRWVENGNLSARRIEIVQLRMNNAFVRRDWLDRIPRIPVQRFGPGQREAQLAADTQNVHTSEITKQMKDSLDILVAVPVPEAQQNTVAEICANWAKQGHPVEMIDAVRQDVTTWWNQVDIYKPGDKLYKKALRGLWWTIKNYKGELREELEKRLWDECKDAAIPYSVCTQGHLARISNVMVGFDDAFVSAVPVGEILQQRMAAISEMDVPYEEQIKLAEDVLAELNIPAAQHANWLAAF